MIRQLTDTIYVRKSGRTGMGEEYRILYMVRGSARMIGSRGQETKLTENALISENPGQASEIILKKGAVYARISIRKSDMYWLCGNERRLLSVNTVSNKSSADRQLRRLVVRLLSTGQSGQNSRLKRRKCEDEFLIFLLDNYSERTGGSQDEETGRREQIEAYIEGNYADNLSQDAVAKYFGYTPQYFSRLFRKLFHTTFLEYLSELRVKEVARELLCSDDTIMKIALNCGFSNLPSMNRTFEKIYGESPQKYRSTYREREADFQESADLKTILVQESENEENEGLNVSFSSLGGIPLHPYWFSVLNLGRMSCFFSRGAEGQVCFLQRQMSFRFGRIFYDLYDEAAGQNAMALEERVMNALLENGFIPWIVIDFREYGAADGFPAAFGNFLKRCRHRYGERNLRGWRYEIFYDTDFKGDKAKRYHAFRHKLEKEMRKNGVHVPVCGPGLLPDSKAGNLRRFLSGAAGMGDITITAAPTVMEDVEGKVKLIRSRDKDYVAVQYKLVRDVLQEQGMTFGIHIACWKDSLNKTSPVNDSAYRAARILMTYLSCYDIAEDLALEKPLDLMYEESDSSSIFAGLPGLITAGGIQKPSYYAYAFLQKTDATLLYRDDHVIATRADEGYFQIICHNCVKPNFRYFEAEVQGDFSEDIASYFDEDERLHLRIRIRDLSKDAYVIKRRRVNDSAGSALACFNRMNYSDSSYIGRDDMAYLQAASLPQMEGDQVYCSDHCLQMDFILQVNEIFHIHILPLD